MDNLYSRIEDLCKRKRINVTTMCREAGVSRGNLTDLKMGRQSGLSAKNADKIASYFGVSVSYLLGTEQKEKALTNESERETDHRSILAAFWEGGEDLPEEEIEALWNDASDYIRFKMEQRKKK